MIGDPAISIDSTQLLSDLGDKHVEFQERCSLLDDAR